MRPPVQEMYKKLGEADFLNNQLWLKEMLFTWQWALGVFLTIAPWILWVIFKKKQSSDRLLHAGLFVVFITSWMDFLGIEHGLWGYDYQVLPTIPSYVPWDFSLLPITIMFFFAIQASCKPLP